MLPGVRPPIIPELSPASKPLFVQSDTAVPPQASYTSNPMSAAAPSKLIITEPTAGAVKLIK